MANVSCIIIIIAAADYRKINIPTLDSEHN